MELLWVKAIAFVLIFLAGMGGGLFPLWLKQKENGEKMLILGLALTAGIFMGAGFLHMLPDSEEHLKAADITTQYAFTLLIAGLGFLLILFLEKVLITSDEEDVTASAGVSAYILMFVLSVHSIITGLALGLENELSAILILTVIIIVHKFMAAFALGINFVDAQFPRKQHLIMVLFFSLMAPLGMVLGMLMRGGLSKTNVHRAEFIFDGLAAGTFFYVATMDNLVKAFASQDGRYTKFALVLIGFFLMAMLAIWS